MKKKLSISLMFFYSLLTLSQTTLNTFMVLGQEIYRGPTHHDSGKFGGALLQIYDKYNEHQEGLISDDEYLKYFEGKFWNYHITIDALCNVNFKANLKLKDTLDYKSYGFDDGFKKVVVKIGSTVSAYNVQFNVSQIDRLINDTNVISISLLIKSSVGEE